MIIHPQIASSWSCLMVSNYKMEASSFLAMFFHTQQVPGFILSYFSMFLFKKIGIRILYIFNKTYNPMYIIHVYIIIMFLDIELMHKSCIHLYRGIKLDCGYRNLNNKVICHSVKLHWRLRRAVVSINNCCLPPPSNGLVGPLKPTFSVLQLHTLFEHQYFISIIEFNVRALIYFRVCLLNFLSEST